MIKRTMLAACVAALVFAALPSLASADETSNPGDPYLEETPTKKTFTVSGGIWELTAVAGKFVKCKSTTGTGVFEDDETGSVKLTFHECVTTLNIPCTTTGEPSGTISTTTLPFHLKTIAHKNPETGVTEHRPGVLITPNGADPKTGIGHFATFKCSFAGTIESRGNGLIGTITKPNEGVKAKSATLSLAASAAGVQTHKFVTDHARETAKEAPISYHLETSFNGGAFEETARSFEGTLTPNEGGEFKIGTTPTP